MTYAISPRPTKKTTMIYATRNPDNTYVFLIEDDADKAGVHLKCYDAESHNKINVYIQKTSLPDWVVDGYHKLKVAGDGIDIELSSGWAVKRGDKYWFLADAFREADQSIRRLSGEFNEQLSVWDLERKAQRALADPGT